MEFSSIDDLRDKIFADDKVTKEEVLELWDIKDSYEEATPSEFDELFSDAVMAWLLEDGKISEEEAQFLIDRINEDEDIDDAEDLLLVDLAEHYNEGNEVPESLIAAFPGYFLFED